MGQLVDVTGSNSTKLFLEALTESLTDVFDKAKADSIILDLYRILAEQLDLVDREVSATRHDNFISVEVVDEEVIRSSEVTDHLAREGAFEIIDIRFSPLQRAYIDVQFIADGQTELVLSLIPKGTESEDFVIAERSDQYYVNRTTVTAYDAATNSIVFNVVPEGDYNVLYIPTGYAVNFQDFVEPPEEMFQSGAITPYPIALTYSDIIYASELITIPGGQFSALQRDEDYTVNYEQGILYLDLNALSGLLPIIEQQGLHVRYRYSVNFDGTFKLLEHVPVFGDTGIYVTANQIRVSQGPIQAVRRVFNTITKKEIAASEVRDNIIVLVESLAIQDVTDQESVVRVKTLTGGEIAYGSAVILPTGFDPRLHALVSVVDIQAETNWIQLLEGARDVLVDEYAVFSSLDVTEIEICTGSTTLRRCTNTLLAGTHYSITTSSVSTYGIVTINFTEAGQQQIGSNSVYYRFIKQYFASALTFAQDIPEHRVEYRGHPLFEDTVFQGDIAQSSLIQYSVQPAQPVDQQVDPQVIVSTVDETVVYIENEDYVVDALQQHIVRLEHGTIPENALVRIYVEDPECLTMSYNFVSDAVIVDYDYGINSIDWTNGISQQVVKEQGRFNGGQKTKILQNTPVDYTQVLIYAVGDTIKTPVAAPVDYVFNTHLLSFDPPLETGEYIFEYIALIQPIEPGTTYYVTYKYGARRYALLNHFAKFARVEDATTLRQEEHNITSLQNTVELVFDPVDVDAVLIYEKGDTSKNPLTSATFFDPATKVLTFDPIGSSGAHVIEYRSLGIRTEDLRKIVAALYDAFLSGPTKQTIIDFCVAMFGLEPEVTRVIDRAFRTRSIDDEEDSNRLVPLESEESDPLNDGSPSIDFLPSRFNRGVLLETQNGAYMRFEPLQGIAFDEGTIEFLLGNNFQGSDGQIHYFFDITGTDRYRNRIALYKNTRGLLVFEVFSDQGKLLRSTIDVNRIRRQEVYYLPEGSSTATLTYRPASTLLDVDEDDQQDIFAAHPTEFIIAPLPAGESDLLPLSITTLVLLENLSEYETSESKHAEVAQRLRDLAQVYELHNSKLTIHSELSFINGCSQYDNVLEELYQRGHEVGVHVIVPTYFVTERDKELYIRKRKEALEDLIGESVDSIDGYNALQENVASSLIDLGFSVASNYRDALTEAAFAPFRVHPFRPSDEDYAQEDTSGTLVHVPGDSGLNYTLPFSTQTFLEFTASLESAITQRSGAIVNSWYTIVDIESFTVSNFTNELALFDNWLTTEIDPRIPLKVLEWRTIREIYSRFLFVEQFTVDVGYGYSTGYGVIGEPRNVGVRALTYDGSDGVLTFDPVPHDGYYVFDYISGWSKFEQTEHFIVATWKLHVKDGLPPFVGLYLDGEPQTAGRFYDFS
ncbi:MAG: hypothetical protein DRJ03_17075 [Chloroflexi bacterium]|nr:MAG: hypothetical protein DRJ03_17075 [Chloroflexota bacterium]